MGRRLIALGLLFAVAAAQAHAAGPPIEVHGHRGARAAYPENSLSAFEYAIRIGVDYLEMDARVSRDGVLVLSHDREVNTLHCKRADGSPMPKDLAIEALTVAELKGFDCGSLGNAEFPLQALVPGSTFATLDEVFHLVETSPLVQAGRVGFHIELKTGGVPAPAEMARMLVTLTNAHGFLGRTIFQSFDPRYTVAARKAQEALGAKARPVVSPPKEWLNGFLGRILFRTLRSAGRDVVPWTANTPEAWDKLIKLGVQGIVTDDPEGLIRHLEAQGLR